MPTKPAVCPRCGKVPTGNNYLLTISAGGRDVTLCSQCFNKATKALTERAPDARRRRG